MGTLDENNTAQDSKAHFLNSIKQIGNNAMLMQRHENGRIETLFVTDEFAKMMECTVEEAMQYMSGMSFYKSTNPEDRPLVRSMMRRHVAYDGGSTLTIQKITAKRNRIWCNVSYSFIEEYDEHFIYCTYTDVSALKQHEERMRSAYSRIGNSYYQVSERTLGTFRVNLTKDSYEEVKGKDLFESDSLSYSYMNSISKRADHYPIESERHAFLRMLDRSTLMAKFAEGQISGSQVFYSIRANGHGCFVEIEYALTQHPLNGDIIAFITERECNKQKVDSTLTSKILAQQFDMVAYLTNGRYGVTIGEAANVKQGSIFPVTTTGYYRSYLEGQVAPVLAGTEEERQAAIEALSLSTVERQLKIEEPYVVDIAIEMDGQTFYKQFDFYSIDPEARFYILLKSDITAVQIKQAALNDQLRAALDAANQANVAKTAFLSSMSHEIRTPMNAIIGLDAIALKDPDLPPHARERLEKIGESAQHLLGLINDVLDMSRIESGRMTLKNEEFSFAGMLDQINTMIGSQCLNEGLNYDCQVIGDVDDYYIGDSMKLKQVLINILGNAVKFTPEGGDVGFTVERTASFDDQSTLRFKISDTGVGMDADYLPKIFDAFSQEDSGKANKMGSTGLGMAISKSIVEMMNGSISVESEKNVGSTFTVNVTLRNSERTGQASELNVEDLRVLVIDDSEVDCEHAKIVLESMGIEADTCQSGSEALEIIRLKQARREAYSMILIDWKMPEQDGLAVSHEIRKLIGDDSTVVVLTAYNWDDIREEAMEAGVDNFMSKPLSTSSVMSMLRHAAGQKDGAEDQEADLSALAGKKVLLAEDVEINAEIMMELLDMVDVSAAHAENGQAAVELFEQSQPGEFAAVLMDIRMPVLDGLGATEAIRALERPDAQTIPIIAMTANAFDEDVQRSLQAGMNAHLSKPVEPDRLYQTLVELACE